MNYTVEVNMATILFIDNNQTEINSDIHIANALELGAEVFVLSRDNKKYDKNVRVMSVIDNNVDKALSEMCAMTSSENIIVIDCALHLEKDELKKIITTSIKNPRSTNLFNFKGEDREFKVESIEQEMAIDFITHNENVALSVITTPKESLLGIDETAGQLELISKIVIHALTVGIEIKTHSEDILVDQENARTAFTLSTQERSSLLRFTIHSINIEELFPNHSWDKHQEESAAAVYHTLAATFIKLGDFDSAIECLALSDRLEDSPRSLALKGLIALEKGETLSAVANMVSSLQEYERRKKESQNHYLRFVPKDLEQINTSLQSGLSALNKRENDHAANHFQEAVFNFDSFYEDCGLKMVKH